MGKSLERSFWNGKPCSWPCSWPSSWPCSCFIIGSFWNGIPCSWLFSVGGDTPDLPCSQFHRETGRTLAVPCGGGCGRRSGPLCSVPRDGQSYGRDCGKWVSGDEPACLVFAHDAHSPRRRMVTCGAWDPRTQDVGGSRCSFFLRYSGGWR